MTAVEDFLWSKVYRSEASPSPSARTASGAATGTVSRPQPCLTSMPVNPNILRSQASLAHVIVSNDTYTLGPVMQSSDCQVLFSPCLLCTCWRYQAKTS